MSYKNSPVYDRSTVEKALDSKEIKSVCEALLSIAFYDPDWEWAQRKFLDGLESSNPDIRGLSATCLGHVARIHQKLDKVRVITAFRYHLNDNAISGQIEDALIDIDMFVK
ncbi:hypothetical protein BVY11_21160 [Pseudomonas amygdali pv. morsprunorum]|nr:hypothetical protein BVY11_21160 [Pseudomonas amygdali pv. morsprunorum]PPS36359.1 hypothetical protein BVY12_11315 [Pseudomonas amygdali pv. morsprunorum]